MRRFVGLLALVACGSDDPCREGFELAGDGHCYPSAKADLGEALRGLPDCDPLEADGQLDLVAGCASGICVGGRYDAMVAAQGEADCATWSGDANRVECVWEAIGVEVILPDVDQNDVPDGDGLGSRVTVRPPYAGSTVTGTGVGVRTACVVDELGDRPDAFVVERLGPQLFPVELDYGFAIARDDGSWDLTGDPDGRLDEFALYGP